MQAVRCPTRVAIGGQLCVQLPQMLGTLVLRSNNGTGVFMCSKEGVTQGNPRMAWEFFLSFACSKLSFLPWHANDAGAGGKFSKIRHPFLKLQEIGPRFGCFPEP
jgi:hypothetical protein